MKIVIIGQGFVGKATALTLNQDVEWHDPPKELFADYKSADVVFVCCFDNVLDYYLKELKNHPCVIIRSTLIPSKVKNSNYAVYPEFLVEARWEYDALNPIQIVFGGTHDQLQKLKMVSRLDISDAIITKPEIASLMKVSTNAFLAMKVIFLNSLYQACNKDEINYNEFKEVLKVDSRLGNTHFNVPGPDGKFGFGGKCFPKDVKWLKDYLESVNIDFDLLEAVLNLNNRIRNDR
jgi:UDP-glucose 6-dehydrogenase